MSPKISVIMPSLNVADYIEECIESVVGQTLDDIEIICIDAGSTDGTLEILEKYESKDSRIRLLHSDVKSYGHQMNVAMDEAKGDYIGIVETDDYVASDMFEKLYALSEGKIDVVKSNFMHVEESGEIRKDTGKKGLIAEKEIFKAEDYPAIVKAHPSIWAGIYRMEFLAQNGIRFMEEAGGGWVDNPFFYETAFRAETIVYTDEAYYYYREFNPTSSSNNLNDYTLPIRRMLDNLEVFEKYAPKTDGIIEMVYMRAFAYLNNIKRRQHFEQNLDSLRPILNEMMVKLDEKYVEDVYRRDYYRYLSALRIKSQFTDEEYENLIKENDYLYQTISELEKRNEKIKTDDNKQPSIKSKLKKLF